MNDLHLELILETYPSADRSRLQDWLHAKGFDPLPMKKGLLLAGSLEALRQVLPELTGTESGAVTVPEEMKNDVCSIRIFGPRKLHSP